MTNNNFFFKVGHSSRSEVIFFWGGGGGGVGGGGEKPLSKGTYMPNKKLYLKWFKSYLAKIIFFFKVGHRSRSRSEVNFFLYEWEAFITISLHAKYKGSI